MIFETLNGRMAPLIPADLIRNFVLVTAVRRGLDTERLYQETRCVFDYDPGTSPDVPGFWRGSEKQGRRFDNRLDLFVFHYLTMRTGREIALGDLFRSFQEWYFPGDLWLEKDIVERSKVFAVKAVRIWRRPTQVQGSEAVLTGASSRTQVG